MDNRFANSRMSIGEASNLAQLALTYYWTDPNNKDLYHNFVILSVLAQIAIDSCKREYEVDPISEIKRIKNMNCMKITKSVINKGKTKIVKCDYPKFMKYTKEIKTTKNGRDIDYEDIKEARDKLKDRINDDLICPMNWLQDVLDEIQTACKSGSIPTDEFFIKMNGKPTNSIMTKIRILAEEYDKAIKSSFLKYNNDDDMYILNLKESTDHFLNNLKKIKVGNIITINRLIEISLGLEKSNNNYKRSQQSTKYARKILNTIYRMDRDKFLTNFK